MKLKLRIPRQVTGTPVKLLAIIAVVAVAGASLSHLTYAATGSLTLSPNSGSYNVGSTITVTLTENSGTDQALSVDALISFPSNKLTFTGDTTVAPFTSNPGGTDTASNGSLEVFRGNLSGSLTTGSQTVSVLTFHVDAPGSATVSFAGGSAIYASNGSTNLLTSSPSATYTLNTPPPAAPSISSFTASPATILAGNTSTLSWLSSNVVSGGCNIGSSMTGGNPSGSWVTPALSSSTSYTLTCKNSANVTTTASVTVTINVPPTGGGTGGGSGGSSGTTVNKAGSTKVGDTTVSDKGNVNVSTPVTVGPAVNQTEGVSKVEYYLNGKLVDTESKAPFTYKVDTTQLNNGKYVLTSKTYYSNGSTKQTTQNLNVTNTAKKTNKASIGISLVVLAAIICGFILIQRRRSQMRVASYVGAPSSSVVTSDPDLMKPSAPPVTVQPTTSAIPLANPNAPQPGSVIEHKPNDPHVG